MNSGRKRSQQALARALSGDAEMGSLIRAPDGRAPRILVGERDPELRDRLNRVLASAGCRVETAADSKAALAAALRDAPDLIVLDAATPRAHRFPLLRQLRADPATRWLPVIMLSDDASKAARNAALDAGADDYLVKPAGARELLSRVGLHLATARVGREANEAVRASERRLAEVLEAIGEAVYAMDEQECILFANRKALEMWNKREEEVVGRRLLKLGYQLPVLPGGQPRVGQRVPDLLAEQVQPPRLQFQPGQPGQVGQRPTAPQGQRLPQVRGRADRVGGLRALAEQPLAVAADLGELGARVLQKPRLVSLRGSLQERTTTLGAGARTHANL